MSESNKKVIVIYKSKYGITKKYAEWIAKEANVDLLEISKVKLENLEKYNTIVLGGYLHAVGINGLKLITDNFHKIKNKHIIVFGVGCSPVKEGLRKHVEAANFTGDMKDKIKFFYLRGAFNFQKLGLIDKIMMNLLKAKILKKGKENLDEDSKGLLDCYDNPVDWTDKNAIIPIVEAIGE